MGCFLAAGTEKSVPFVSFMHCSMKVAFLSYTNRKMKVPSLDVKRHQMTLRLCSH